MENTKVGLHNLHCG